MQDLELNTINDIEKLNTIDVHAFFEIIDQNKQKIHIHSIDWYAKLQENIEKLNTLIDDTKAVFSINKEEIEDKLDINVLFSVYSEVMAVIEDPAELDAAWISGFNGRFNSDALTYERIMNSIKTDMFFNLIKSNGDFAKLFLSAKSRSAALKNLEKQESQTQSYTEQLKEQQNETTKAIEGAAAGFLVDGIDKRINELSNENNEESYKYWLEKRKNALKWLLWGIVFTTIVFLGIILIYQCIAGSSISSEYLYILIGLKVSVIAILYSRYYFAQKNYRIYSDLHARYKHMRLNAGFLSGYLSLNDEQRDSELHGALVDKVSTLLTSGLETHHFKDSGDNDSIGSIIQNINPLKK